MKNPIKKTRRSRGCVNPVNNGRSFRAYFTNPITESKEDLGSFPTSDEAQDCLNKKNYDFYVENSYLLPRGISLGKRDKTFIYTITIKGKSVFIGSSKSLEEILNIKLNFINSLIQ